MCLPTPPSWFSLHTVVSQGHAGSPIPIKLNITEILTEDSWRHDKLSLKMSTWHASGTKMAKKSRAFG